MSETSSEKNRKIIDILSTPLLIILIPLVIIGIVKGLNVRLFYPYIFDGNAPDERKVIRSLGKFSVEEDYRLKAVSIDGKGENKLAVYINEENGQKLFLSILREHLNDGLDEITPVDKSKVEATFRKSSYENKRVNSFRFTYLLPWVFRKDDLSGMGNEAIVRGMSIKAQERFFTHRAEVFYIKGEFVKIGLFKKPKGRWHYPTPVFDFMTLHEGALAFIKSRRSGRVIMAVGVNRLGQFQEEEFRTLVEDFEPA